MANKREPDFDLDVVIGQQSELWVDSVRKSLAGRSEVEVKAPKPFLKKQSAYVEYQCLRRDGWRPSGIATTKAKLYFFTFGSLPGGLVIETEWLKRAARLSFKRGKKDECERGSHPTRGVLVSLLELWETRDHDP
jgi:hypothetical protein